MTETGKSTREDYFESKAPGVYLENEFRLPRRTMFTTGVPAFLGLMRSEPRSGEFEKPIMLTLWSHFERYIGTVAPYGVTTENCYLAYAVRGFFENGGRGCYVVVLKDGTPESLEAGLAAISTLNTVDLVCTPDLMNDSLETESATSRETAFNLQQLVVNHCESLGDRFAILDSRRGDGIDAVGKQWSSIDGKNGAIYYPWLKVRSSDRQLAMVPPCGHVAGVFARTDRDRGVHKAPANEVIDGVVGLERLLTNTDQDALNSCRVNCLRSFPGRGIRVWGARTLSGHHEWTYVNVRRLFLTAVRWMSWHMYDVSFEPNDSNLWARIQRELNSYFMDLYRAGALKGDTPREAFYVKCDAETNPPEVRERDQVVTEIGLSPMIPYEFVIVRLIHGPGGVSIAGPIRPKNIDGGN
jgi:phage tail sheath protein FI